MISGRGALFLLPQYLPLIPLPMEYSAGFAGEKFFEIYGLITWSGCWGLGCEGPVVPGETWLPGWVPGPKLSTPPPGPSFLPTKTPPPKARTIPIIAQVIIRAIADLLISPPYKFKPLLFTILAYSKALGLIIRFKVL